ncbi:hypothetical protein [Paenibacillus sp. FSL E2-0151]|uniref:hypothetical protein n=1 Tax=Paenibacillus sp. FSL E2-0151 TaxID=2921357 RepID=UPI0030EBD1C6
MKTILDVKRRLAAARCPYPVSLMDDLEEAYEENERLRKELALKDATIADLNHNRGLLSKELEEARKIKFPRQPGGKYGWTIDFSLLRKIQQLKSEYPCNSTLEEIESVLLVLETFWGQEGEGNQRTIEVTLTNAGYKPHQINWDNEE